MSSGQFVHTSIPYLTTGIHGVQLVLIEHFVLVKVKYISDSSLTACPEGGLVLGPLYCATETERGNMNVKLNVY